MPVTRRQHFVPQFYLRNFAVAGSPEQVGMYRFPGDKFFRKTGIKGQAFENDFYGDQAIEKAFSQLESAAAALIANAVTRETLPGRGTRDFTDLAYFAFLQASRTPEAADKIAEMAAGLFRHMTGREPDVRKGDLEQAGLGYGNPAVLALRATADALRITYDLHCKLLCNRTTLPFITSDHPAVLYNQFLEPHRANERITGLAVRGLQLFLPLDPTHALVYYDPEVYKVGGRRLTSTRVEMTDEADVRSLNLVQATSAGDNLYFSDLASEAFVRDLVRRAERYRGRRELAIRELVPRNHLAGTQGVVLDPHQPDVRTHLKLKCIAVSPHAVKYAPGGMHMPFRDPELTAEMNAQLASQYPLPPLQFAEFVPADGVGPGIIYRGDLIAGAEAAPHAGSEATPGG